MKTLSKIDWGLIGFIVLLFLSLGIVSYKLGAGGGSQSANRHSPTANSEPPTIYTAKDSTTHAKREISAPVSRTPSVPVVEQIREQRYKSYVTDTLAPALKIATQKIQEITRINAKLEGELKATREELAENKERRVYYQNKYLNIITRTDSLGNPQDLKYTYNAEINIVHFSKRTNFWSKEQHYIDVSSPDKNFRINGLEHYRTPLYIRPKSVGVGFQVGYGLTQDFKIQPYMGVGVSWNVVRL